MACSFHTNKGTRQCGANLNAVAVDQIPHSQKLMEEKQIADEHRKQIGKLQQVSDRAMAKENREAVKYKRSGRTSLAPGLCYLTVVNPLFQTQQYVTIIKSKGLVAMK